MKFFSVNSAVFFLLIIFVCPIRAGLDEQDIPEETKSTEETGNDEEKKGKAVCLIIARLREYAQYALSDVERNGEAGIIDFLRKRAQEGALTNEKLPKNWIKTARKHIEAYKNRSIRGRPKVYSF